MSFQERKVIHKIKSNYRVLLKKKQEEEYILGNVPGTIDAS